MASPGKPRLRTVKVVSVVATALLVTSCVAQDETPERPVEQTSPAPDSDSGFEEIVSACNSAKSPPQASIQDTRAWAQSSTSVLCVDELKTGEYAAFNLSERELSDAEIEALTPGEEVGDDAVIPDEDTPARFVLDDIVYEARYYYSDVAE